MASLVSFCNSGKKYDVLSELGEGTYGLVHHAVEIVTKSAVALKLSGKDYPALCSSLVTEYKILQEANSRQLPGFPKVYDIFQTEGNSILVLELLGEPLDKAFPSYLTKICCDPVQSLLKITDQMLRRLEDLHSLGIVHGDVKPENMLLGRKSAHTIYLIDFGLSLPFWDDNKNEHIPDAKSAPRGTPFYMSINVQNNARLSRRDDLESLAYCLADLYNIGNIPWADAQNKEEVMELKRISNPEDIFKGLPTEYVTFLREVRALKYAEKPDYNRFKAMFRKIGKSVGISYGKDSIFS